MAFPEYHKINALYKRDDRGNFTEEFARPEFEYLWDNHWFLTEKVDGTNIRIGYDTEVSDTRIGGRTDNAQIPTFLLPRLKEIEQKLAESDLHCGGECDVTLYGEGYGAKIQKGGGNYIPGGVDFVLFDVKIGDWWLQRTDVADIARGLDVHIVPPVAILPLWEAEVWVANGITSDWGDFPAEGVVATPFVPLFARDGSRVITKIKTRDYAKAVAA